jgi:hypothetical protein
MRIGLDLDNTLICYDGLFRRLAREAGLWRGLEGEAPAQKAIRAMARRAPDGDRSWQRLQGQAYGPRIMEAPAAPGALDFLRRCRAEGAAVRVISHKTRRSGFDPTGTDLRTAALDWMGRHGLFAPDTGLGPEHVRFAETRRDKVALIRAWGCTHFVDDLEETFREPDFPAGVERILYAPMAAAGTEAAPEGLVLAGSFPQLAERLFGTAPPGPERVARLAGCAPGDLEPLAFLGGGRNSRVYRATLRDGRSYALKAYFRHPGDPRDRLGVEFRSLAWLRAQGLDCVPRPVAADPEAALGLYEFIQGERIPEPAPEDLDQACAFLGALRRLGARAGARDLPDASEACFSLQAAAAGIQLRFDRLLAQPDPDLGTFLAQELAPAWSASLARCRERCRQGGTAFAAELPPDARTLSPSDFGCHNALKRNGSLVFLDFEYFGWDDPAKLVADLLQHPAQDLSRALRARFARGALAALGDDGRLGRRTRLAYPLFGIKWCLILLNEFLPDALDRRRFALAEGGPEARRARQLAKARRHLRHVMDPHDHACL